MTSSSLPYHTLAFDLDGTLLDPAGNISTRSLLLLRQLAGLGLEIVLASGRMTARVSPFATELGFPITLIAYNGAETLQGQATDWTSIATRPISRQTRDAVFELCRTRKHFLNIYADGKLHGYHPDGLFTASHIYQAQTGATYSALHRELESVPKDAIAKLLVVETPEIRNRLFQEWSPLLSSHCSVAKSNPEYLELMNLGVSKGSALQTWLGTKGLTAQGLIAFGDADNDKEMLELAGLGIAMGNATPGLRAVCTRVSPWTNAEDGVARELAALFNLPLDSSL
jgi:Cof subfamily protein (haloacid dehalogenase superfamily)